MSAAQADGLYPARVCTSRMAEQPFRIKEREVGIDPPNFRLVRRPPAEVSRPGGRTSALSVSPSPKESEGNDSRIFQQPDLTTAVYK